MEFLKKFFNDDSTTIGLCKFNTYKYNSKVNQNQKEADFFFNPFQSQKTFVFNYETNFSKNTILL